jgi:hypothetical protein
MKHIFALMHGRQLAALLAILLITNALTCPASAQSFSGPAGYSTSSAAGANPAAIAAGDLNSDGLSDLVVVNAHANTLVILLGVGGGAFATAPSVTYSVGLFPSGVALGDLNGDGRLDIVTADQNSSSLSVFLNTGSGTALSFGARAIISTGTTSLPINVALGDVNGDGHLDLVACSAHNAVVVVLNSGAGTFPSNSFSSYPTTYSAFIAVVGDLNGDGRLDIVATENLNNAVDVLLNTTSTTTNTAPTFAAKASYLLPVAGDTPLDVKLGDVSGDGKLDIVTANYNNTTITVLVNAGAGTFGTNARNGTDYAIANPLPGYLAMGDVNGDGKLDLAIATSGINKVIVLPGNNTPSNTFPTVLTFSTGGSGTYGNLPYGIALADLNGNGTLDIATANYNTNSTNDVTVLLNQQPSLTSLSPTSGAVGTTVTLTGTNLAGATVKFNNVAATVSATSATSVTVTVPAGATTGNVVATTAAGSSNGLLFTLGTAATVTTAAPASLTVTSAVLGGNVTSDGGVSVTDRGVVYSTTNTSPTTANTKVQIGSGTGSFSQTIAGLTPGTTYYVRTYAVNSVGTSYGSAVNFTTPPNAPSVTAPGNGTLINTRTPTYTGSALAGSTVRVYVDGTLLSPTTTAVAAGTFSLTQPASLPDGPHSVFATAQVGSSAQSANSTTNNFTVDASSPTAVITSSAGASGSTTTTSPIPFTVSFSESVTGFTAGSVILTNGTLNSFSGSGSTYTFNVTPAGGGLVTVNVPANKVQDGAGNGNTASPSFSITYLLPVTATTWTGNSSTDWFASANWTAGVPTSTVDALIPVVGSGKFYPFITTGIALARDLTVSSGALVSQSNGTIDLKSNLNLNGAFTATGGVVIFSGTGSQSIGGSSTLNLSSVTVNKTNGGLTLGQDLSISTNLTLTSGVLTTGSFKTVLGSAATLSEVDASYVSGVVETTRTLGVAGTGSNFGGIGVTLTPAPGSTALPGSTLVRRATDTPATGVNSSQGIRRYFIITPTVDANLNIALTLTYLDHDLTSLSSQNEARLGLFKSNAGASGPWARIDNITRNAPLNTVTGTGITNLSTWTLGNLDTPLPVELAAFTATAASREAVRLAWSTASEKNSAHFNIERSLNGTAFERIGTSVAAGSSSAPRAYDWLDVTLPVTAAVLYYRLQQVDLDGTTVFSPVRAVFIITHPDVGLTLVPNPARATTLMGTAAAAAVTVYDALGHLVLTATADATGSTQLALPSNLSKGVYIVRSGSRAIRLVID